MPEREVRQAFDYPWDNRSGSEWGDVPETADHRVPVDEYGGVSHSASDASSGDPIAAARADDGRLPSRNLGWWMPEPDPHPRRRYKLVLALGVSVVLAVVGAVLMVRSSEQGAGQSETAAAPTSTSARPAPRSAGATSPTGGVSPPAAAPAVPLPVEKLLRQLPRGYPGGTCTPADPPKDAVAKINCGPNVDAGGPVSATYSLVTDTAALDKALNGVIAAARRVVCPGNIQSPGPWRRNATPQVVSGVLYCGMQASQPVIAWTDDAKLVVSTVKAGAQGSNLGDLYAWWSSHS